mmetsp:Transcript_9039/g.19107  ORF Transcript_9039/g.19107 Transcript_9039/m.19107 type:complete len:112 (-) Transcript_9039:284-619(-)
MGWDALRQPLWPATLPPERTEKLRIAPRLSVFRGRWDDRDAFYHPYSAQEMKILSPEAVCMGKIRNKTIRPFSFYSTEEARIYLVLYAISSLSASATQQRRLRKGRMRKAC